jgi:hypothetical protein
MVEVGHDPSTCAMHRLHDPAQAIHQGILVEAHLGRKLPAVQPDEERLGSEQARPALGSSPVEGHMPVVGPTVKRAIAELHRGHDDPVWEAKRPHLQRS